MSCDRDDRAACSRVGEREAMAATGRQVGKSQLEGEIHQGMLKCLYIVR